MRKDERLEWVPLTIEIDGHQIIDDETFDQKDFLARVAASPKAPISSCPSPGRYQEAYQTQADRVYVVTLSSKLSGSYNSAELGRKMYLEQNGEKNIFVIDSESASAGQIQIVLKLMDLEKEGLSFEEVVDAIKKFRDEMYTLFVLDNLDTFIKSGRIAGAKALLVTTLNIKPIMGEEKGSIVKRGQSIGTKKALRKMAEMMIEKMMTRKEAYRLVITHCNAYQRAVMVRDIIMEKCTFIETLIMDTTGISSMYANDGGVIVTV
jgi:DegV family protein with EDD domain